MSRTMLVLVAQPRQQPMKTPKKMILDNRRTTIGELADDACVRVFGQTQNRNHTLTTLTFPLPKSEDNDKRKAFCYD